MSDTFEDRWRELPDDLPPWQFEWRRDMLLEALNEGDRWLDLGCGDGRFTTVAPNGIGVDIAEAALERARRGQTTVAFLSLNEDGTIPVGHGEVDLVWCSQVIERVPDAVGLLQEVRRVLKPGGRLLLTTTYHSFLRRLRPPDPLGEQVRFFTRRTLRETIEAAGLGPVEVVARRGMLVARATR